MTNRFSRSSTYYFTYQGKRCHWEDYPVAFHWTLMVEMAAYLRHLLTKNEVKLIKRQVDVSLRWRTSFSR